MSSPFSPCHSFGPIPASQHTLSRMRVLQKKWGSTSPLYTGSPSCSTEPRAGQDPKRLLAAGGGHSHCLTLRPAPQRVQSLPGYFWGRPLPRSLSSHQSQRALPPFPTPNLASCGDPPVSRLPGGAVAQGRRLGALQWVFGREGSEQGGAVCAPGHLEPDLSPPQPPAAQWRQQLPQIARLCVQGRDLCLL